MLVLGIDAAWTKGQPSGVALVEGSGSGWRLLALAPSYEGFVGLSVGGAIDWSHRPTGSLPNVEALIEAASSIAHRKPDVVAVDMPLSTEAIRQRREADNAVSRAFGSRHCGTHSPSAERPGAISGRMRDAFERNGLTLRCADVAVGTTPALIEVYPHTALLRLLPESTERRRYKASKTRSYWREASVNERRRSLREEWATILAALSAQIDGIPVSALIPADAESFASMKRFEDAIDALICAWMGIEFLAGRAEAYGDATGVIWT